jgi:CO/xanthine dehydrogenase FAD-binding subunit
MHPFRLHHPRGIDAAIALAAHGGTYIAGGSELTQLLKDNVETADKLVDLDGLPLTGIHADATGLLDGAHERRCRTSRSTQAFPRDQRGLTRIGIAAGAQYGHDGR